MNRLRDLLLVSFIASLSLVFTPVYAGSNAAETITQAEQDLKSATRAGAVWRLVDKATGSGAVGINKLLKLAKRSLMKAITMKQNDWLLSYRGPRCLESARPSHRNRQNHFTNLTDQLLPKSRQSRLFYLLSFIDQQFTMLQC